MNKISIKYKFLNGISNKFDIICSYVQTINHLFSGVDYGN